MDADGVARRAASPRTAKSCGPDVPTLISTRDDAIASHGDGDKSPVSGESTKETVKTIAREMPDLRWPVVTSSCAFIFHARLRVRVKHPAFPAPSVFRGNYFNDPDACCVAGKLICVIARRSR